MQVELVLYPQLLRLHGCYETLGAAPTTAGQLGFIFNQTSAYITNVIYNTSNSPSSYGTITWNTPGTWIVNYFLYAGTSTLTTNASVSVFSGSTGGANNGASTAPWTQTGSAPLGGVSGTNAMIAAGSFVTTNTGTTVTWDIFVNTYSGSLATFRGYNYTTFTRIG